MGALLSPLKFAAPVDRRLVAVDRHGRGYSCTAFADPPGQCWNGFVHDNNELVTVIEGRLELVVGTERLDVGPGDEAFIPRRAVHSVRNIHGGMTRWLFGYD